MNKTEFLNQSGTNWLVDKRELFDADNNPSGGYGIYRADNNNCLGVVGERYTPTQNHETLELLLETSAQVGLSCSSGGTLNEGRKVYYQFPLDNVQIGNSDTKRFITAMNSHDGSSPIGFGTTNIVVVCQNTFYQAMKDVTRVRHTTNSKARLTILVQTLRDSLLGEEMMIDNLIKLSTIAIPSKVNDDFLIDIIGGNGETSRTKNRLEVIKEAINIEKNTHGNNLYAVFNGVTRFTNHLTNYKDFEAKRNSLIMGTGSQINARGYEMLVENFIPKVSVHSTSII